MKPNPINKLTLYDNSGIPYLDLPDFTVGKQFSACKTKLGYLLTRRV